jgi:SAM-dependent methyltransferase
MANVSPESILKVASGFMAAKHLFSAVEIGIFEALSEGPRDLSALASATGTPHRTTRILADAMTALGFLEKSQDGYRNTETTQAFLSGRGHADLRPWARFWNRISYPAWTGLDATVRSGTSMKRGHDFTAEESEIFSKGVEAFTRGAAMGLVSNYDFARHRKVLDVGGGTGSFLQTILDHHPRLHATLFETPSTAAVARSLHPTFEIVEGDVLSSPLPEGSDAVILANVVHYFGPEKNLRILNRLRKAIAPRGRLLLVDFWTDATKTQPPMAALMAGEFAVLQPEGDVYSVDEVKGWLAQTGFVFVEHKPLAGPQSLIVAEVAS